MVKTNLILCIFLIFQGFLLAQVSESDHKKIETILGKKVVAGDIIKQYPYSNYCNGCTYVPSLTLYQDTTGIVFNSEYLLFRDPIAFRSDLELSKWINSEYVTVKEYTEFQTYVKDSIAREKLFYSLQSDKQALEFLTGDVNKVDIHGFKGPYNDNRELDRQKYSLNWNKKFSYNDPQYLILLADMYLPFPQRLNRKRTIDERKLIYGYTDFYSRAIESSTYQQDFYHYVVNRVPTLLNSYLWSTLSNHDRDCWSVIGQLYPTSFLNECSTGMSGVQAKGFCHWKQDQLQKEFTRKGLAYKVVVSLPTKDDISKVDNAIPQLFIPENDFTKQWQISVGEYNEFVQYVRDSVLYELLYQKIPSYEDKLQLLKSENFYFDEGHLEYQEIDPSKWKRNRTIFNLNHSQKIAREYKDFCDEIFSSDPYQFPVFSYWYNDAKERSIIGELTPDDRWIEGYTRNSFNLVLKEQDSMGEPVGLDYSLDNLNVLGHSNGVRAHVDLSRFHKIKQVEVSPLTNSGEVQDLMNRLTYEQAVAFYYWKYPLHLAKAGDDWQQFVLPSKEQFEKVQKGETIKVLQKFVVFPTPVFRYVVHVFPWSE